MIWEKSKYYKTPERISGLLNKISNEIIKRCKNQIRIKDMLDGDVEKCMRDLRDSIDCGKNWKKIYEKTAALINKKSKTNKWDFNLNTIFAQIDGFVQRCTELEEICEGQLQFARKGSNSQIPKFGGSRGPEIVNILEEIKVRFCK
jgi:dynein heavy chain, axonemal